VVLEGAGILPAPLVLSGFDKAQRRDIV
jgi:hypothetical protein